MIALCGMLADHERAVQAVLIDRGLRLRWLFDPADDRLTIADLFVIVTESLNDPTSALIREAFPDLYGWTLDAQLLALAVDEQRLTRWAFLSGDEGKIPDQLPRPGVEVKSDKNLLWNNGQSNLDVAEIQDPREWLALEDPRWQKTA